MGDKSVKLAGSDKANRKFIQFLLNDVRALEYMLENDMFERGVQRIGVEQELCMIDEAWRPAFIIQELLKSIDDPHFTTELAKFNMEINLDPHVFTGHCLSDVRSQLQYMLELAENALEGTGNKLILTGILPTIRSTDLGEDTITPLKRYQALNDVIKKMRDGEFQFRISGKDEFITRHNSVIYESCNTSFQVHFQVDPDEFVKTYNWAMAVTAPLMAIATNSPMFLGKRLWHETRIALFQQSIDFRNTSDLMRERSPRVTFGNQWVKDSIVEVFQDDIVRHKVLLNREIKDDSMEILRQGGIPKLEALQIHNGTIYKWNRACYGITNGKPHLRIENRILPAGPTIDDQIANAALWFGLMNNIPEKYSNLPETMEFDDVKNNFKRAARHSIDSQFNWGDTTVTARELILDELLGIAKVGLEKANIREKDIKKYLGIIENRTSSGMTGSKWLIESYEKLIKEGSKDEAIVGTTASLYRKQQKGKPVHTWSLASIEEAGSWVNYYWRVDQIMSTDLYAVNEEDDIDLVTNIMDWRKVRHVPVENSNGELVGLITSGILVHYLRTLDEQEEKTSVKEIMITDPISISSETLTTEALSIMKQHKISCLPVVKNNKLVGIVTEHDFVDISAQLFKEVLSQKEDS